ncbi:hypothetical protein [Thioalkalivibrio thiocyanodenitrificans]|uniref:hypothetical protein n=1 Tax=Thioalkalivibrio thiocyanodenitrificans TaxID=243063 RepID=UPI00037C15F3|nr:hypothetical protein [Thioalkalivibrio thiocyanodenitrificans]
MNNPAKDTETLDLSEHILKLWMDNSDPNDDFHRRYVVMRTMGDKLVLGRPANVMHRAFPGMPYVEGLGVHLFTMDLAARSMTQPVQYSLVDRDSRGRVEALLRGDEKEFEQLSARHLGQTSSSAPNWRFACRSLTEASRKALGERASEVSP